jgi:hypothetical protein
MNINRPAREVKEDMVVIVFLQVVIKEDKLCLYFAFYFLFMPALLSVLL